MYDEKNTDCALYGTPECKLLNSPACLGCSVGKLGAEDQADMKDGLSRLLEAAPEETVEPLHTSKECLLCKGERKNETECYALFDMYRKDPAGDWSLNIGNKKLAAKTGFMLLPLQVCSCKKCRRRFRVIEFLPTLIAIALVFIALFAFTRKQVYDSLYDIASWLPVACFVAATLIAAGIGFLIRRMLIASYWTDTKLDMSELEPVAELEANGWQQVGKKRAGFSKVVFADSLRTEGVYTRALHTEAEANAQGEEAPAPEPDAEE